MRSLQTVLSYLASSSLLVAASNTTCKCTPGSACWPSAVEWSSLNTTLSGALLRSVPPASVCYPNQPNYDAKACAFVLSQWGNSSWHAQDPISIDYPIWANNSCNPIYPNGTSLSGDVNAGKKGCSIGNYPVYVVNATTPAHVGEALKWANKNNIRVVVKNTGHSYPGRSIGYGSLSIWTHHFRGIEYIESFKPTSCLINGTQTAARIGAGIVGYEAQAEMAKHKSILVTGANPSVGLVGWLTGGGHGYLTTAYGMGADNLLEATIVTPNGEVLVASPCQNSDIFFAIRGGGGGTYGVVLEVVVKTFPTPQTTSFTFAFQALSPNTSTEYYDVVGFFHSELQRLKEGGMQGYYYVVGPPIAPTLSFSGSFLLFNKPNGTAESLMAPIEQKLKQYPGLFAAFSNSTTVPEYWDIASQVGNEEVGGATGAFGSRLLSPESLADPNVTARVLEEIGPRADNSAPLGPSGLIGHFIARTQEPSYYPDVISMTPAWRKSVVHLVALEGWPDGAPRSYIDSVYKDITWNKTEPLRKLSPDTGAYINEADSYEPEWQQAFFGKNYPRLLQVKKKVDPGNVLWCRRCVGSEALAEQIDGRLCRP